MLVEVKSTPQTNSRVPLTIVDAWSRRMFRKVFRVKAAPTCVAAFLPACLLPTEHRGSTSFWVRTQPSTWCKNKCNLLDRFLSPWSSSSSPQRAHLPFVGVFSMNVADRYSNYWIKPQRPASKLVTYDPAASGSLVSFLGALSSWCCPDQEHPTRDAVVQMLRSSSLASQVGPR